MSNPNPIVTRAALIKRINRRIESHHEAVRVCRYDSKYYQELGRYYLVDVNRNRIEGDHLDLEEMGRDLGVLGADEVVEADESEVSQ